MARLNLPGQVGTTIAAPPRVVAPGAQQAALKILWVTDLEYDHGERRPSFKLVVAGANPGAELLGRAAAAGAHSLALGLKPFFMLLICGVTVAPVCIALLRLLTVVQRRRLWRRAENALV